MKDDYKDIIDLQYPYPSSHKKMAKLNRAAQFAPFAALNGFDDAIEFASQVLEERKELDESQKEEINKQIVYLKSQPQNKIRVRVCYFQKDPSSDKGQNLIYEETLSKVKEDYLLFTSKKKIYFKDIYEINIDNNIG